MLVWRILFCNLISSIIVASGKRPKYTHYNTMHCFWQKQQPSSSLSSTSSFLLLAKQHDQKTKIPTLMPHRLSFQQKTKRPPLQHDGIASNLPPLCCHLPPLCLPSHHCLPPLCWQNDMTKRPKYLLFF